MTVGVCKEKLVLLKEYNKAVLAFADAVIAQFHSVGQVSIQAYRKLQRATELARADCDQTRAILERHIAEHECQK